MQLTQLVFEQASIGLACIAQGVILACNRSFEDLFGFSPGELTGKKEHVLFAGNDEYEKFIRRQQSVENQSFGFDDDIACQRQDGTIIHLHACGSPIDRDGDRGWVWTFEDISERRLAELAFRDQLSRLEQSSLEKTAELTQQLHFVQQLIEAIPGPVFYKDANYRYLGCNSAFEEFIGIPAADLIGKTPADIAPPELAEKYFAADRELLDNPGAQIYEAPVRYASGESRDVMFHKATFFQPDGSVGGLIGVMLDITERKRMEASLQQAATVFNNSTEGITITKPNGSIIAVNQAFTKITGYSQEEVIGRNPRMLQSGRQSKQFYRDMWDTIYRTGRWQGEIWNRHKEGHIYPEWLTISAVLDNKGSPKYYVGVFSDISDLKKAHAELDFLAHHDSLTGLPNRLLLKDRLGQAIQRAHRNRGQLAVLFIDLDRFKNINDSLGHHIGDQVLLETARRLARHVRGSDTVARLGGDEFIIALEDINGQADASAVAEKILEDFRHTPLQLEQEFFIGASIGISLYPEDADDSAGLIKHADIAMYRAKDRGRNTFEFFTRELPRFSLEHFNMEANLRRAIERDELSIHLQPQFSLADDRLIGAEALVRWQHPEQGQIPPGKFIPLAEESGLIISIGEWVMRKSASYWAELLASGIDPGVISVNISGIEFRRGGIPESVRCALDLSGLPPERLELEITESAIMNQAEHSIQTLRMLRAMGVNLAIDDFGTGYSSLAYLKRLPFNRLKIDQSFVRGLPISTEDCAIVRAVIALARSLQLETIAEGVETEAQRSFLYRENCSAMQGYLRAKPMPVEAFKRFLEEHLKTSGANGKATDFEI